MQNNSYWNQKRKLIPLHYLLQFDKLAVFFHSLRCPIGFQGVGCKTPFCRAGCYNGGTCVKRNVCKCPEGFEGPACLSPVCRPLCRYGGKCIGPGKCRCPQGFVGSRCEKKRCLVTCLNGGQCIGPYVCQCMPGYSGQRCEIGKPGSSTIHFSSALDFHQKGVKESCVILLFMEHCWARSILSGLPLLIFWLKAWFYCDFLPIEKEQQCENSYLVMERSSIVDRILWLVFAELPSRFKTRAVCNQISRAVWLIRSNSSWLGSPRFPALRKGRMFPSRWFPYWTGVNA